MRHGLATGPEASGPVRAGAARGGMSDVRPVAHTACALRVIISELCPMITPSCRPHCLTDSAATQARNAEGSLPRDGACHRESCRRVPHSMHGVRTCWGTGETVVGADLPIGLDDQRHSTGPPAGVLPANQRGLHEQRSGGGSGRCRRHPALSMTVNAAEEPAWTCAAAWGSMRRIHQPRGSTMVSHTSGIDVAKGYNGRCRTLALGVTARRRVSAA
jgi:hypothetical protein